MPYWVFQNRYWNMQVQSYCLFEGGPRRTMATMHQEEAGKEMNWKQTYRSNWESNGKILMEETGKHL